MSPREFESKARVIMSRHFGTQLPPGSVRGVPKEFDFVSKDKKVVGDAKYYTLVNRTSTPPAKFATIAEHVWLLEKTDAPERFLVFGNQVEVPRQWLEKYGHLVDGITFYFIDAVGRLQELPIR